MSVIRTLKFIVEGQCIKHDLLCDFSGVIPGSEGHLKAEFQFSPEWAGRDKAAAFWSASGRKYPSVALSDDDSCIIPQEALQTRTFKVQIIGTTEDGATIPTNRLPVFQSEASSQSNSGVTPDMIVDAIERYLQENPPVPGADGKDAYAYAQDAGYTGTESEFAKKLAEDTLDSIAVEDIVENYLQENPPSGEVATEAIKSAVEQYLQENPPAGGSGDEWERIADLAATDYSTSYTIDQDLNGNPFSLKSMIIFMVLPKHTNPEGTESSTGYAHYKVNDQAPAFQSPSSNWDNGIYVWKINAYGDLCTIDTQKGNNAAPYASSAFHSTYMKRDGMFSAINSFTWRLFNGYVCPDSKFIVYGVRV